MPKVTYKTPLNTERQKSINTDKSMTKQEFKDECNPTKILEKFARTGLLDHAKEYEPQYGEQSSMSYHEALQLTAASETMFNDLPSATRKLFNHDVGQYLDWISDPENIKESKSHDGITSVSTEAKPPNDENRPTTDATNEENSSE